MKFEPVPLSEARGKILGHNIAGANGQRLLRKGKPLTDEDLEDLRALGRTSVYVAQMEADDVDENTAAQRIAEAICGPGLFMPAGSSGRANLLSREIGIIPGWMWNGLHRSMPAMGITLATLEHIRRCMHGKSLQLSRSFRTRCRNQFVSQAEAIANGSRPYRSASMRCLPSPSG